MDQQQNNIWVGCKYLHGDGIFVWSDSRVPHHESVGVSSYTRWLSYIMIIPLIECSTIANNVWEELPQLSLFPPLTPSHPFLVRSMFILWHFCLYWTLQWSPTTIINCCWPTVKQTSQHDLMKWCYIVQWPSDHGKASLLLNFMEEANFGLVQNSSPSYSIHGLEDQRSLDSAME